MNDAACACHAPKRVSAPRGRALRVVSTTLLILMPKCPFCLVGWMGALGLGGYASHAVMIPSAVLALFCASQAAFFFTARRASSGRRDLRSLAVAVVGVVAILAGTLLHLGSVVRFIGVALLVLASISNAVATSRARIAR